MEGIPPAFLDKIEKKLEEQHKLNFLVTTQMGKSNEMYMEKTRQYNANYIAAAGLQVASRLEVKYAFYIVLTNYDINYPSSNLRYVFSANYDGISVVSIARINPINYGGGMSLSRVPDQLTKLTERALKLINKSIGRAYYGYAVSSNINSVMYGPIMGLKDLDDMGLWYKQ